MLNKTKDTSTATTTTSSSKTKGFAADKETERNTQFNKFSLASLNVGGSGKYTTGGSSTTTTMHESRYVTKQEGNNFSFGESRTSTFKPIVGDKDVTGAKAIKVQDIPDGVLGRPVEFESN